MLDFLLVRHTSSCSLLLWAVVDCVSHCFVFSGIFEIIWHNILYTDEKEDCL